MRARVFFDLLWFKTQANLRAEVAQYHLNYIWWAVEPALTMGIFYLVFGIFMNAGTPHFVLFLLIGTTQWQWFARTVDNASRSILGARLLIMQVRIPKVIFPLEVFLQDFCKHLFVMALFAVFLAFYPISPTAAWFALPLVLCVQAIFNLAVAILCAALVPFVPDLKFIISTGLQLMFFGSGIFYDIDRLVLPEHRPIMYLNPIAGLLQTYRRIIIGGHWPDWTYLFLVFCGSLAFLAFSIHLTRKFDRLYPRICQQ